MTSHSPAFISLTSNSAARYRVISDNNESKVVNIDAESDTDHFEKLQDELGIIEIHKEIHKKYSEKISELEYIKEQMVLLKSDAANEKRPIVLTEGKTDKSILDTAYEKIFSKKPNYIIRPCDNISKPHVTNGGCPNLSKMIESIHFEDKKIYIAIFDHDKEGLDCFKKLRNFDQAPNNHRLKIHKNGFAFALLLPVPEFRQNTPDCVCIEFLFEDTCFKDQNGKGLFTELDISLVSNGVKIDLPLSAIQLDLLPISPVPKITGGKNDFAERVVKTLDAHCFEEFKVLFSDIDSIVSQVHSSDN
ncbi:hypothetical protein [Arsukibacterium indicum]|uniref:DUF4435 domain-containing protein n=1 Tax=Arsukibacterium indicum TaxID=2848612 RepID=A0ABS6MNS9_9GAMM|nr:hypothetical protein [Arsukibacterium indicum]MBV2130446.1 hypothetical protein [Arsukibacterium indicum]